MIDAAYLTEVQKAAIRRHLGYQSYGSEDMNTVTPYYRLGLEYINWKLTHISGPELGDVVAMLTNILTAYQNYLEAQNNISVLQIAVIKLNPNEFLIRRKIYKTLCQDMANYFGIPVGPFFSITSDAASSVIV